MLVLMVIGVLVEGEEPHEALGRAAVGLGLRDGLAVLALLLVVGDGLGVEGADLKDVEGDAAPVAAAGPLRVEAARGVVGWQLDRLVEEVNIVGGAPRFRVGELDGAREDSQQRGVIVRGWWAWRVEAAFLQQLLEGDELGVLVLGQVAEMTGRPQWASGGCSDLMRNRLASLNSAVEYGVAIKMQS
ncbi:hypothetical protein HYQ46_003070 [Verticillium longisporum]|nr:hypothetical protein HYQ46_003070 [Verticillium longisporum]